MSRAPARRAPARRAPARRATALLAAVVASIALSGCLEGSADLRVRDDGSGELVVTVEPPLDMLPALVDLDDGAIGDLVGADGDAVVAENIGRPEAPVYRFRFRFDDHREVSGPLLAGVPVGDRTVPVFSAFELTETDDGWQLAAAMRPLGDLVFDTTAGLGGAISVPEVEGTPSVELAVELPGSIVDTNAPETDGDRALWQVTSYDAPTEMLLINEGSDPNPVRIGLYALGGVVALLVLITIVGWLGRGSQDRRLRRRAKRRARNANTESGWQAPAVDALDPDQPVSGVPLEWQTVKPTEEPQLPSAPAVTQPPATPPPLPPPPPTPPREATVPPLHPAPPPQSATPPHPAPAPQPPTPAPAPVPAGWYPDPAGSGAQRWWDGTAWTEHTA